MKRSIALYLILILLFSTVSYATAEEKKHGNVPGFEMTIQELDPLLIALIEQQKEWDATSVPQTLDEITLKPDCLITLGDELKNVKAKVKKKGNQYFTETNLADLPSMAGLSFDKPDAVDYPDDPLGDPYIYIGGRAKEGGNYSNSARLQEPGVYATVELTSDDLKRAKWGEWIDLTNCWAEGPWFWMFSATKYLANIKNDWADTISIEIRKGFNRDANNEGRVHYDADYIVQWGYDPKQQVFLFNIQDTPEYEGFVAKYSTKTGKLIHFNRPGNLIITSP